MHGPYIASRHRPWGHMAVGPRACVLLVDDENDLRALLAEDLERRGYVVLKAESGEAALLHLAAGPRIRIMVTDLSMPGMGGLALIDTARARIRGLPAVLLTGHAPDCASLPASGTCRLLTKPVRGSALAARIAELLATSDARSPAPVPPAKLALQPLLNAAM